jgi:hypothetical protein
VKAPKDTRRKLSQVWEMVKSYQIVTHAIVTLYIYIYYVDLLDLFMQYR